MENLKQPDIGSATPEQLEEIADSAEFACQLDVTTCVLERFVATVHEVVKPVEATMAALQTVWPEIEAKP